jgi:hypothetical protein
MLIHGCSLLSCRPVADWISFACSSVSMCVCVCGGGGLGGEGGREREKGVSLVIMYSQISSQN